MTARPCIKCKGLVGSEVLKCPTCGTTFPQSRIARYGAMFLIFVGLPVVGMLGYVIYQSSTANTANAAAPATASSAENAVNAVNTDRTADPKPAAAAAAELPRAAPPECRIKMTGSSGDVPVFPTAEGLDEYVSAATSGDSDATEMAFRANAGFLVPAATRCIRIDVGILKSKVRVLDGAHRGETGWVPTEFTKL